MALPVCTFCEQREGLYMATTLDDGDTQVACAICLPGYALGVAAALTQGMTKSDAESYQDAGQQIMANLHLAARATGEAPKPRAKRKPPPAVPTDGSESNAAVLVALDPPCPACGSELGQGDADKLTCGQCGHVIATVPDDGISGNQSAGALTQADLDQIEQASQHQEPSQ